MNKTILHCAIYTRKSSEEGLEQDFNSLHAQREACAAYIESQKHEGWKLIKTHYDDGGFSGGNMERPALKQLLEDIEEKKINTVVVYKVDRLTRSLTDFAKIIDLFDKYNVSFVSVTQQFNTTTSMGRLTLNVLFSFAQFEREVTSERIKDKIAASKKKGMWMGGVVPLGYNLKDKKLLINTKEAQIVKYIYRRYLELGCVRLLKEDLDRQGIRSRIHGDKGGYSLARGLLYRMLSNPIYIGQIRYEGTCYQGQHQEIVDKKIWEQVQKHIAQKSFEHKTHNKMSCLLSNKLFDISGEKLISVHTNKKGKRYRYYISRSLMVKPRDASSSGWRLPGQEIEQAVAHAAAEILQNETTITETLQKAGIEPQQIQHALDEIKKGLIDKVNKNATKDEKNGAKESRQNITELINKFVQRVELEKNGIRLTLFLASLLAQQAKDNPITIKRNIPMRMKRRGIEMKLVINGTGPSRVDQTLLKTIVRAHRWFNDLATGKVKNMAEIASREKVDKSHVSRVINLVFLAPDIVESIIAGHQPADLNVEKLTKRTDLPLAWNQQRQLLIT